jgi:NitT/TauT family transport system permease protein
MVRRLMDIALVILAFVGVWQAIHVFAPDAVTSPAGTVLRAVEMLGSSRFWPHAGETAKAFGYSIVIALLGGLLIGLPLGLNRTASEVAEPMLVSVYSLPKVTLYPVILLVFGLGLSAKVAFGAIHGIIPVAIFAMNGIRHLPPVYARAARAIHLSPWRSLVAVLIPAALPEIVTGARIGFSLTLLGVLIGEMFASQRGLGFLIMNAIGVYDVPTMLAIILIIGTFAVAANAVLLSIDRRLHHRAA